MYITLFLHLLEWNWKIPNLVPRPWSGPRVPFHLTFNHYPHCPLSNSTDLPATHQKQKQTKHAPSSKPSHLLFFSLCQNAVPQIFTRLDPSHHPNLKCYLLWDPPWQLYLKQPTVSLLVIFITAFTTTYILVFNLCVCLLSVRAPWRHVSHIDSISRTLHSSWHSWDA